MVSPVYLTPFSIFMLLIAITPLKTVTPPIVYEHNLMDLYGSSIPLFDTLSQPWTINGQSSPGFAKTHTCGASIFMGGLVGFTASDRYERSYSGLSPHDIIYYTLKLFSLNGWSLGDTIKLEIDGATIIVWEPYYTQIAEGASFCGDSTMDDTSIFFIGKFSHNTTALNLKVSSSITSGSSTASFGIRGVRMGLGYKRSTDIEGSCIKMEEITTTGGCACHNGYYAGPSGQCLKCSSACSQCFGPGDSDCFSCKMGYSYDGNRCVPCTSNCQLCTGASPNQCIYCSSTHTLYWDHTCRPTTCSSPYIQETLGDMNLCKTPCQPNGYLMWDNSCSAQCNYPYVERIEGDAKFCDYPCKNITNGFLLWNNSCSQTCNFYQRQVNSYNFCDACQPNTFMYPNGTCLPNCDFPRKQRAQGGSMFCDSPCEISTMYYFPNNRKCKELCEYPYIIKDSLFCVLDLSEDENKLANIFAGVLDITGEAIGPLAKIAGFLSGGDPGAFCFAILLDMLQYIRYINIKYPPKLQNILDQQDPLFFEHIFPVPQAIASEIPRQTLPRNFEQYELESSFLISFWQPGIIMVIALACVLVSMGLVSLTKKLKTLNSYLEQVKTTLKWNFTLLIWISYSEKIVVYSSFEFRTANFDSFLPILSFLFCVIINLIAFIVLIKIINVIRAVWNMEKRNSGTNQSNDLKNMRRNLNNYKTLFNEYKNDSLLQQAFLCLFTLKVYLFYACIAYLYDHQLTQTIIITFINVLMVLYLIISRPLKSRFKLAQHIIQETFMLIVNTCTVFLASYDLSNADAYEDRIRIGEIIVACYIGFSGFGLFFVFLRTISSIFSIFKSIREHYKNKRKLSLNMFTQAPVMTIETHLSRPQRAQMGPIQNISRVLSPSSASTAQPSDNSSIIMNISRNERHLTSSYKSNTNLLTDPTESMMISKDDMPSQFPRRKRLQRNSARERHIASTIQKIMHNSSNHKIFSSDVKSTYDGSRKQSNVSDNDNTMTSEAKSSNEISFLNEGNQRILTVNPSRFYRHRNGRKKYSD